MSNKTKATLDSNMFLSTKGSLKVLETVLNFERVHFSKTCENVASGWTVPLKLLLSNGRIGIVYQ